MEQLQVNEDVIALLSGIKLFDEQCNEKSEQCKFWNNFRCIVGVIKNWVLADRGNFFVKRQEYSRFVSNFAWSGRHSLP